MYSLYRAEILKAAETSRLDHFSDMHLSRGQGPNNSNAEPLCTDYFYTPQKKPRCLVHLSGVHGVEGYLGSLIQRELLKRLARQSLDDLPFQIVIVHAVNPWGMMKFQRGNSQNVDLNRNSLQSYQLSNPEFAKFEPFFRNGRPWELIRVLPTIAKLGMKKTVHVVTSGQTDFPKSLFFSGHKRQAEILALSEQLQKIVSPQSEMFFIDVHTGLGQRNQESLILDGFEIPGVVAKEPEETFLQRVFNSHLIVPNRDPGFSRSNGVLSLFAREIWGSSKVRYVFQEFGTCAFYQVLNALIHKKPEQMLSAFFPDDSDWRQHCVNLGLLRFIQMMENLQIK